MSKLIIFITDDDPQLLNTLESDLKSYYKTEYKIMKVLMDESVDVHALLHDLKEKKSIIVLFIADHVMPKISGISFLAETTEVFPSSKKCLFTTFDDTQEAIKSIDEIGLDYYVLKPWSPPDQNLHPVLDDLLDSWKKENIASTFEGIRIIGAKWSRTSHIIKEFLSRNQIPYLWQDYEKKSRQRAKKSDQEQPSFFLPAVYFPDCECILCPTPQELAEKIGLQTKATQPFYDLIVIVAGPAGLTAGVYRASEGLKTLFIDKEATGGQAGMSSKIENYLGFPKGISGTELAQRATIQVKRLRAEILLPHEVVKVTVKDPTNILKVVELEG